MRQSSTAAAVASTKSDAMRSRRLQAASDVAPNCALVNGGASKCARVADCQQTSRAARPLAYCQNNAEQKNRRPQQKSRRASSDLKRERASADKKRVV